MPVDSIKMMHFVRARGGVNGAANRGDGLVFIAADDDALVVQQRVNQAFRAQKLDGFNFEWPAPLCRCKYPNAQGGCRAFAQIRRQVQFSANS